MTFERRSQSFGSQIDQSPMLRGLALLSIVTVVVFVISFRLMHLQLVVADKFLDGWDVERQSSEILTARTGRILTSDGKILAQDRDRFDITVHYRWLEFPSHAGWLKENGRKLLPSHQRRDRKLLVEKTKEVQQNKIQMWNHLIELVGIPEQVMQNNRDAVQKRIERIHTSVEKRRQAEIEPKESDTRSEVESEAGPWWKKIVGLVKDELTRSPHRSAEEPIIIAEQLQYHSVLKNVPLEVVLAIESNPNRFPGIRVQRNHERLYAYGDHASPIVGLRRPWNAEDREKQKQQLGYDPIGYVATTAIGQTGMEKVCEHSLRGRSGEKTMVKNRRGEIVRESISKPTQSGKDLVLTLNSELQTRAEKLLDDKIPNTRQLAFVDKEMLTAGRPNGGCILVIDIHTGELITAATSPRPDLSLLADGDPEYWNLLQTDPRSPLFSRLTQLEIPPGSVFKTVTALSLLGDSKFHSDKQFYCQGYLDSPNKHRCYVFRHYGSGHAEIDLNGALCKSCNVYFFSAAREAGAAHLVDWCERLGFGRPTGLELPNEGAGHLPHPGKKGEKWYPGDTLGLAIGQSSLLVTPLQIVRMMAAVANGGKLVTPTLIKKIEDSQKNPIQTVSHSTESSFQKNAERTIPGMRPENIKKVQDGLRAVVNKRGGTGYKTVRHPKVAIAGKTGTAELGGKKEDHAWFAGYVPADKPRYAFVVVMENGGSGGRVAGPLAKEMVQSLLDLNFIQPDK